MEVFETSNYYIFSETKEKRDKSLWWNRLTGEFTSKKGWDLSSVDDIECLGITHGIVGTVSLPGVYEPHIIIIKDVTPVGVLYPPNLVYKIKSICLLSSDEPDTILSPCPRHSNRPQKPTNTSPSKVRLFESSLNKTWGAVKSAGSTIKSTTQQAASLASNQVKSSVGKRDPIRIEKKVTEEIHKIFDETDSFYYCIDADITNNLQRRSEGSYDERFFWNRHMLQDILNLNERQWILPIIQGFVQVEQCVIGNDCFTLALVSRRSRHRAGTRYKRRGVDEFGKVANYVETEQILSLDQYQMAFTQIRGSVPVYWSQPGYKYRPPPRIDKNDNETQLAFEKHFNEELKMYKSMCLINLVEQSGKEKIIGEAYANHVVKYNSDKLMYVTFDFHEYCRGMRFENVSALIEALAPEAGSMGFHWKDNNGTICDQKAVFRVNCMDCLDRTNVVQTAIGKTVLESQLVKLGLAPPYSPIPEQLKAPFMVLWANNGDIISKQYAGTNALKGDFTRTGERKISGIMKDGMNSANRFIIQHFADTFRQSIIDLLQGNLSDYRDLREDDIYETIICVAQTNLLPETPAPTGYFNPGVSAPELHLAEGLFDLTSYYLARFKDTYRQATTDLMLGNHVSAESLNALGGQVVAPDENDALEGAEHARLLVEDCRRLLLGSQQFPVGAWGLIDAAPNTCDPNETEVDIILLLTDEHYIVAEYDSHMDKIARFEKVPLINVNMVEIGLYQQTKMFQGSSQANICIRLNYTVDGIEGYYHMFRSANIRFFNNVAVVIKTHEELMESLTAIIEFFRIALENRGKFDVPFLCGGTLQRRKSRTPMLDVPKGMPRNLSESQLVQIGSKALSNVAGQFSKFGQSFNPIRTKNSNKTADEKNEKAKFTVGKEKNKNKNGEDFSSDSDENDCSIYEPDINDLVEENPIYNENDFLPSVGIVMSSSSDGNSINTLQEKECIANISSDVNSMSISSVTDNIIMPAGMLESGTIPVRSATPEIRIQASGNSDPNFAAQKFSQSSNEMRSHEKGDVRSLSQRDLSLNLTASQSDNALKQLKNLTSPLSKFAKGMQNFGMNLDPRKIASKSGIGPRQLDVPSTIGIESKKLEDLWDTTKCKTKLIAL